MKEPPFFLRPFASRLGLKAAAVLGGIMAFAAATLVAISTDYAESLGRKAADQSARALRQQAHQALQRVTAEQARRYGAQLRRTRTLSQMLAYRTGELLASEGSPASKAPNLDLRKAAAKAMLTNGPQATASLIHFAGASAGPEARRAMARTAPLDPLLVRAKRKAFAATAAWMTSEAGFVRYVPNLPLIDQLPQGDSFDARQADFYRAAAPSRNPDKEPVWTRVYQDPAGQGLMVTASTPVYGTDGNFHGVTGIDVALADLVDRILATKPFKANGAPEAFGQEDQFGFLTSSRGRIIAFPHDRLSEFGLDSMPEPKRGRTLDINLLESDKAKIRSALRRGLETETQVVARIDLHGEAHLLALHTVPGTNWLLGNVVAEQAVLASVRETRTDIDREIASLTRSLSGITLIVLLLALVAVTGYVVWSLVGPLRQLALAAGQVRSGQHGVHVPDNREDELGQTGHAFNAMSDQLAELVDNLEAQVAERTREAEAARHYYWSILENSPVAIGFFDGDRRIQQVNSTLLELSGYTEDQVLGHTPDFLYADPAEYERVGREAYPILRKGQTYATTTHFRKANGQTFAGAIQGRAVNPEDPSEGFIWAIQDITEQKRLEDELRLLATTFRNGQATMIVDAEGHIERVNPAFTSITGFRPDEIVGCNPRILQSGYQDSAFYRAMWQRILTEGHWEGELWVRRKDGTIFPVYESISVVKDEAGEIEHFVAVFHDITEQKRLESELDYRATHDPLTGLLSRKHLEHLIGEEINRAIHYGNTFSLIMFDFDQFKAINDRFGHHIGDRVLIHMTGVVADQLRESDHFGRWGGEEFMILLPQTGIDEAASLAERLRRATAEAAIPDLPPVTISLGVSQYHPGDDLDEVTHRVDSALYRAKTQGRNRVERA